jgi:predicted Rossmann fold nucleotide-binding protein DprA/Smf involved in DNA uptake
MFNTQDLAQLKKIVGDELKQTEENLKAELKPIRQDISKIRKDQNSIIKFFDEEYPDLRQRVERLEKLVNLVPSGS